MQETGDGGGSYIPKGDLIGRLADVLSDAIAEQSRTYLARVTNVGPIVKGRVQAYSEVLGNIMVLCRTSDNIELGDMIFIRKSGPQKYAAFMYVGAAAEGVPATALEVREPDGAPIIKGVSIFEFPNGTVTQPIKGTAKITFSSTLTVRNQDGSVIVTPVEDLTIIGGTVTDLALGAAAITITGGSGGGGLVMNFLSPEESLKFLAPEAMTLTIVGQSGTGTISWTLDGSPDSSPFTLSPLSVLIGTITGAVAPVNTAVAFTIS
jgi:hypothetical protein